MWKASEGGTATEGGPIPLETVGPRIMTKLTDVAALACSYLTTERVAEADGEQLIYDTLGASPLIKELQVQAANNTQNEFLRLRREQNESMDS